jgi:hypothetical protein
MLKIMFLIVLVACIGPFFIKTTDGIPLVRGADVSSGVGVYEVLERFMHAPGVASMRGLVEGVMDLDGATDGEKNAAKASAGSVTQVYKWRDELGIWQFSDGPNVAEGAARIEISNQINLMPALDSTGHEAAQSAGLTAADLTVPDLAVAPELLMQMGQTIEAYQKAINDQDKALEHVVPKQP